MNEKELRRRLICNSQTLLARHLVENSSFTSFSNNTLFHNNPIVNTLLANAFYQIMIRKVDKGTQTLLRIPTKPDFYIRYILSLSVRKISFDHLGLMNRMGKFIPLSFPKLSLFLNANLNSDLGIPIKIILYGKY